MQVTDEMMNRFLAWPLPDSVCSDGCVTQRNYGTSQGWPKRSGTNLLNADEARAMLEYVLSERIFNVDPWPDLETAKRRFTLGDLWVLGSQYADLLGTMGAVCGPMPVKGHKTASVDAADERTPEEAAHPFPDDKQETPRTDRVICDLPPEDSALGYILTLGAFARQLERELTIALGIIQTRSSADYAASATLPRMICPRCEVDRLKAPCPNHIGCPMVGDARGPE